MQKRINKILEYVPPNYYLPTEHCFIDERIDEFIKIMEDCKEQINNSMGVSTNLLCGDNNKNNSFIRIKNLFKRIYDLNQLKTKSLN